jgi:hypothetical protein
MKALALILIFAPSLALADASKDAVAGVVIHGDTKVPRDDKRVPNVKDEPTASKTAPLFWLTASKTK